VKIIILVLIATFLHAQQVFLRPDEQNESIIVLASGVDSLNNEVIVFATSSRQKEGGSIFIGNVLSEFDSLYLSDTRKLMDISDDRVNLVTSEAVDGIYFLQKSKDSGSRNNTYDGLLYYSFNENGSPEVVNFDRSHEIEFASLSTINKNLYAVYSDSIRRIDAKTGKSIETFGIQDHSNKKIVRISYFLPSPDGRYFCLGGKPDSLRASFGVYVMENKPKAKANLIYTKKGQSWPSWAPNSNSIVISVDGNNRNRFIVLIGIKSPYQITPLTEPEEYEIDTFPIWSPRWSSIYFSRGKLEFPTKSRFPSIISLSVYAKKIQ
jgi:hypothetical protein